MKAWLTLILAATLVLLCGVSRAAQVSAVPTGWRVQIVIPNSFQLYFTGSQCNSGALSFRPTATEKDKDRLYALLLAAKTAQKRVLIYYTPENGACWIDSFLYQEE